MQEKSSVNRDRKNRDRKDRGNSQERGFGKKGKRRTERGAPAGRFAGGRSQNGAGVRKLRGEEARRFVPGSGKIRTGGAGEASGHVVRLDDLFPLTAVREENFALLHTALNAVLPLKKAHREELPRNIITLSRLLTENRADLRSPYWAKPALTSAYVHYFLPWNVYRLSRLLAGLQLPEPCDGHFVLDVGSGPLTMPLALWLANPAWREKRLQLVACDCAGHPLHIGRDLLVRLAREEGVEPWDIHLVQAPILQALRSCQPMLKKGQKPLLVTAANVLNELPFPKRARFEDEEESEEDLYYSRFEDVVSSVGYLLRKGPDNARALFVEPGTRLGGLTLMRLRSMILEQGLEVHGPCPHQEPCPLLQEMDFASETSRIAGKTWCHATFAPQGAPDWLEGLTAETGFARESLSLSWLEVGREQEAPEHAGQAEQGGEKTEQGRSRSAIEARVISNAFSVPDLGRCRYACSQLGLLLLAGAEDIPDGASLTLDVNDIGAARKDRRSGARILRLVSGSRALADRERPDRRKSDRMPARNERRR